MAQPKLGDVAARAGVSPTTVSRVLNNRGYLSQKTRDKVFAAIRELGYRPNAIARSLQERRSHIIGLIFPTVAHPFYGEMVYRLESRLANAGYRVTLCNSDEQPELEHRYLVCFLPIRWTELLPALIRRPSPNFLRYRRRWWLSIAPNRSLPQYSF